MVKEAMGWVPTPHGCVVSIRKATGQQLHTYHGLIGYCLKDEGKPWFRVARCNVTDDDFARGKVLSCWLLACAPPPCPPPVCK